MNILITGGLGFIGFSLSKYLLEKGFKIYCIDNQDKYYSVKLKKQRLLILKNHKKFIYFNNDITNFSKLKNKIAKIKIDYLFHFAAQAGVRYSLINPKKYYDTNVKGFNNIIEAINKKKLKKIIYASSSSVYGDQKKFPTDEKSELNAKNVYGKSKIINELNANIWCKILKIPILGLRFFTVYGEWGRPDMFIIKLLNRYSKNKMFHLNKSGNHDRDFTHINDVVRICYRLMKKKSEKKHLVFNICRGKTINIKKISEYFKTMFPNIKIKNVKANKADVHKTHGSNLKIKKYLNYNKFVDFNYGLVKIITWFKEYKINKFL